MKVRMPAVDDDWVFASTFSVEAKSGRTYQGWEWQQPREPHLLACADYHRPTTAAGWVPFEVRNADAKELVMSACLPDFISCKRPLTIRLR
ncbi:MAG: hypothetical protein ABIG85_01270 [Chloroflexota bacterium]